MTLYGLTYFDKNYVGEAFQKKLKKSFKLAMNPPPRTKQAGAELGKAQVQLG